MKTYEGIRDPNELALVFVDDQLLPLAPSLAIMRHSPTGFAWGYNGSGPAQLALAILLDYYGDRAKAWRLYQRFKQRVISQFPQDQGWMLTGDQIDEVCNQIEADQRGL